ncbi:MAG TPA: 4-hydroxy-tetrahydrodipicolinate reductase, partial [bacterium]|nr:4-hydroxy-tetrahydrodipicolinate reductase [bacterium]
MTTNIIIVGANGRMGKNVIQAVQADPQLRLVGATDSVHCSALGKDAGANAGGAHLGVIIGSDLDSVFKENFGVVIDFSSPVSTIHHVGICQKHKAPLIVGTTGLNAGQEQIILETGKFIPIVRAPNMSTGVNVLFSILAQVAEVLNED